MRDQAPKNPSHSSGLALSKIRFGTHAFKSKRLNIRNQTLPEIKFDLSARQEYLTGFHKRKLQRKKRAREEAEKQEREDRIRERKTIREERKSELLEHVKAVNASLREGEAFPEGHNPLELSHGEQVDVHQSSDKFQPKTVNDKYTENDQQTIVTIEAVDVTRKGLQPVGGIEAASGASSESMREIGRHRKDQANGTQVVGSETRTSNPNPQHLKKRRKTFRYEGKSERKATAKTERSSNKAKAKARRTLE